MKGGKTVAFILPFDKTMVSIYVRAKCLADYAPLGWKFQFVEGEYPARLNFPIMRTLYQHFFYIGTLIKLKRHTKKLVVLIIKPSSVLLIVVLRYILRIKIISDINDPLHLPPFNGYLKTLFILKCSNRLIFESSEYYEFWRNKKIAQSAIIEDTPQNECVFIDYLKRERQVVWIGSPSTSEILLRFVPHLLLFNKFGFSIKLLGPSASVSQALLNLHVKFEPIYSYDNLVLISELASSEISFVPMEDCDLHNLRGNLKAKISMACGCLTIASKNAMHQRLIDNNKTGFIFSSYADFNDIIKIIITKTSLCAELAFNGNQYVVNNFTRTDHAQQICRVADEVCQ